MLEDPSARDIRDTEDFARILQHFERAYAPAFGKVRSATSPAASADGRSIAFVGEVVTSLDGRPQAQLCLADRDGVRRLTESAKDERSPQFSPDGTTIAFTSDRDVAGVQQLSLLDVASGEVRHAPAVDGTVEYLHWSPDGSRVLLGVAGLGADLAGGQGSGPIVRHEQGDVPDWMPLVDAGFARDDWRSAWIYDCADDRVERLAVTGLNVWEVVWGGPDAVLAVTSPAPDEAAWYTADLRRIALDTAEAEVVHTADRQLGLPAASPSGQRVAVVQACSSDRWVVAGDVVLTGTGAAGARRVDTLGVDVTQLQWLDESRLAFLGQRGLDTVAGVHDADTGETTETWCTDATCGDRYPVASFLPDGTAAVVHHSYTVYPELAWVRDGKVDVVASLRHAGADYLREVGGEVAPVTWTAPDGWEIEGLLATPDGPGPHPLVVFVHGGPVWSYRNRWMMGYAFTPLLVSRGYAVLHPNPRGSSGRGQEFAEAVFGDMGGVDTHDYLSGIDALVADGVVDPDRVGVTGQSYGGFMSAWLITQDPRFAAAVPMAPVTNWYSQHHTSNIPHFDQLFLADDPHAAGGRYHERSPVMFADRVRTPTLQTTGLDDRCTPPGQALEFHSALLEAGVPSVCVSYPNEGHGVRGLPALLDQCTRLVDWYDRHMPAQPTTEG
ncbi:S9 family peptidase [Pimelobacter simplex]|uniref:S9 family peptidase n=1 Tax=Nocardioides simplex TaxID=2045 RepID=A0A7J5DS70_NOCSI|nr:S9 family peptidase [Pimelobacter simplex]KAB2807826.1 S9 family peptidase [Pimelobacter simplex]